MTAGHVNIAAEDNIGRGREDREGSDGASARPYRTALMGVCRRWRVEEGDTGCGGDKDAIMGEGMQMRRVLRGTGQIGGVGPTV
jgi:hypothetical protein